MIAVLFILCTFKCGNLKKKSEKTKWIFCPHVGTNHEIKLEKYKIKNFPLYCPKCKREPLIEVRERFSS